MSDPSHPNARAPWTVRVAAWSSRHRWPVVTAWFVVTLGLFAASIAMGRTRSEDAVDDDTRARRESAPGA